VARIRYLKPEFFSDEDIAELPFETRLFYQGLWCFADKEGRLEYRPKYFKVSIFPYDKVDIEKCLNQLSNHKPFIQIYEVDEKKYIQILKWNDHQSPHHTEKNSIFPPAPPYKDKEKDKEKDKAARSELEVKEPSINRCLTVKSNQSIEQHEIFWKIYPKRKNKGDSEKAWLKLRPSIELQQKITQKVNQLKLSEDWIKENGKFIPYPATWLNAKGWEDEITTTEDTRYDFLKDIP
jgi:hypothetical protein